MAQRTYGFGAALGSNAPRPAKPAAPAKGVPASTRYGNSETAPGVPPPVGGPPIDPAFEAYRLSAGRSLQLGAGENAYQQGVLQQSYGYGAAGAANPYSRAALASEFHKRSKLGTTNSMAAAGQLRSGAYGRAQGENDRQYSIAEDQNRREYDQAVHGANYGQAQQAAQYGVGMDQEAYAALLRSLGITS